MAAVDPLERLTNLVALLLETPRPLSIDDIADALVGQYPDDRTARRGAFERDKRLLRDEGVPIELTPGDKGGTRYHIDKERYELPDLGLSEDEPRPLRAVAKINLATPTAASLPSSTPRAGGDPSPGWGRATCPALSRLSRRGTGQFLVSRRDERSLRTNVAREAYGI